MAKIRSPAEEAEDRKHLSQAMVVLYGWSCLVASIEVSLLKHTVAALTRPPVSEPEG